MKTVKERLIELYTEQFSLALDYLKVMIEGRENNNLKDVDLSEINHLMGKNNQEIKDLRDVLSIRKLLDSIPTFEEDKIAKAFRNVDIPFARQSLFMRPPKENNVKALINYDVSISFNVQNDGLPIDLIDSIQNTLKDAGCKNININTEFDQ
jgi:hypothetical protein